MDSLNRSLQLIEQAQTLEQSILDALTEGDSAKAEQIIFQRQHLIESIPFNDFSDGLPQALVTALQSLQQSHQQLTSLTESVQQEIERQLTQLQKGKAGSKIYQRINDH